MKLNTLLGACAALCCCSAALAVPTLQVGAPGGPGQGTYADYVASSTSPTEADTALTSGGLIFVGGAYGPNTLSLGLSTLWSTLDPNLAAFDGHGAVLVVAVPDGAVGSLTVNGNASFFSSTTNMFPNNHDPLKDAVSDFYYFDIGSFNNLGSVPDFASETGSAAGEIKSLTIAVTGFSWAHFDVMAIEETATGRTIRSTIENNPGSHDVTWKEEGGGGQQETPEPMTLALVGLGLLAAGALRRRPHA